MDLYEEIIKALKAKERLVLATLIRRMGSAPRALGAKYLIRADGSTVGSIGGGCVEAEVWQEAQEVLREGTRKVLHFRLTPEDSAESGMICGGNIDIFLEPLKEGFLKIYQEIRSIKQEGGAGILATLISSEEALPHGDGTKLLIKPSGERFGSLLEEKELEEEVFRESERVLNEKKPEVMVLHKGDKKIEVLLEPILSEPTVFLFGAGHISQQLAPLAKKVEFKVVVIDDREMFANYERFPEADEIIVTEFEKSFDQLSIDETSYLVIVTRGHLYDGIVLEQALKTRARYIGMIGSRKKIQTLFNHLLERGVAREDLARVRAPIGIEIHAETPEEIAISIIAELIKVRRSKGD